MSTMLSDRDTDRVQREIREWIDESLEDRKRFEPTWHEALEFARGKQWLVWSRYERRMIMPPELEKIADELYTADRVTEYRMTALGEMSSDDDRPELLLIRDDEWDEEYQKAVNRAVAHAWEREIDADSALMEARRLVLDLGCAAIRPRFDPLKGPIREELVPYHDGKPVLNTEEAIRLYDEGAPLEFKPLREGRMCWDVLSPFNMLVPPGVPHEKDFPREGVVRPVLLDEVKDQYPEAADLKEDVDIASLMGLSSTAENQMGRGPDNEFGDGRKQKLRGHVWLYTVYERPCPRYPEGQTVVMGGAKRKLLEVKPGLPHRAANGEPSASVGYLHWWRVTGRFWSRGLVESMQDGQRRYNKRATQNGKIIDRAMPKVFVQEDGVRNWPTGLPMEVIELGPQIPKPEFHQGLGPGDWMWKDLEQIDGDLAHATGIYGPSKGENPENVTTYSQLALIAENDQTKRRPIYQEHRAAIARLVEAAVHDIRVYWGRDKKILVTENDEEMVSSMIFDATRIPDTFIVRPAKGAARPRSQAAMLQLINDLKVAAIEAGIYQGPEWADWYRSSMEAGDPLDFPEVPASQQTELAELENHMLLEGDSPRVAYYDNAAVHVPIHRLAQDQARLTGDMETFVRIEEHVAEHQRMEMANQQQIASLGGGTLPADPEMSPQEVPEPEMVTP